MAARKRHGSGWEQLEHRRVLTSTEPVFALTAPEQLELLPEPATVVTHSTGDLNGDGLLDLILAGTIETDPNTDEEPDPNVDPDFESDGDPAQTARFFLRAFLALPDGGFASGIEFSTAPYTSIQVEYVAEDVIVSASREGLMTAWKVSAGEEDITFAEFVDVAHQDKLLRLTDINGDNQPDVLMRIGDAIVADLSAGYDGTENDEAAILATSMPGEVLIVDANHDGAVDLVFACRFECEFPDHLMAMLNDGLGNFDEALALAPLPPESVSNFKVHESSDRVATFVAYSPTDTEFGRLLVFAPLTPDVETDQETKTEAAADTDTPEPTTPTEIPLGGILHDFFVQDVDGDGVPDLLVQQQTTDTRTISVTTELIPGFENGLFGNPIALPVDPGDSLIRDSRSGAIHSVSQTGTYARLPIDRSAVNFVNELQTIPATFDSRTARIDDFNGDGYTDVVGSYASGLEILLGTHDGDFVSHLVTLDHLEQFQFFVGEFDQVQGADVVVVGTADSDESTHALRIDLRAETPHIISDQVIENGIVIEQADLDADGVEDFVLRSSFRSPEQTTSVLLGRGDSWTSQVLSTTSATVAIQQLDDDDAIEVYVFDDPIRIFKFVDDAFVPWGDIPKGTSRAVVADFNDDGLEDFLSILKKSNNGTTLSVFSNMGDGSWEPWQPIQASDHELLDINNDGLTDVASKRHFFISNADGTWDKSAEIASDTPEWAERDEYVDVNGDGLTDVAKLHATTGLLSLHEFTAGGWVDIEPVPIRGFDYQLADLNNDGLTDLLDFNKQQLSIWLRTPDGWAEQQSLDNTTLSIRIADHDGDGVLDIGSLRTESVLWFRQTEDGNFAAIEPVIYGPHSLEDVNGDQLDDIVLASSTAPLWQTEVHYHPATEAGFGEQESFARESKGVDAGLLTDWGYRWIDDSEVPQNQSTLLVAHALSNVRNPIPRKHRVVDIDEDGDVDILAVHAGGLALLLGIGPGDFDADGKLGHSDLEMLRMGFTVDIDDSPLDLTADGIVDQADIVVWVRELANTYLGDADLDGDVDFSDFLRFSQNFGASDALWAQGDFDNDGHVSFPDFLVLSRDFGNDNSDEDAEDTLLEDSEVSSDEDASPQGSSGS